MGVGLTGPGPPCGAAGHRAHRGGQDTQQGQTASQGTHTRTCRHTPEDACTLGPRGGPRPQLGASPRGPSLALVLPQPPVGPASSLTLGRGARPLCGRQVLLGRAGAVTAVIRLGRLPAAMMPGGLVWQSGSKRLRPPRPAGRPARPGTELGAVGDGQTGTLRCHRMSSLPAAGQGLLMVAGGRARG